MKNNTQGDFRLSYDGEIIKRFKEENPEKTQEIRDKFKSYYSNASDKTIEKYVDHEILPPVINSPQNNYRGGSMHYFSDINSNKALFKSPYIENECCYIDESFNKAEKELDIILDLIDYLDKTDQQIIRMRYGLYPYEQSYTAKETMELLNIPYRSFFIRINKIQQFIKDNMGELDFCL